MKKIIKLLLVLLSLLSLVGCHGNKGLNEFVLPEEFDTSKDYEITFWAKYDTNITQKEAYNKAIADFEQLYPNIKINIKLYTDYSRIYNDVITNISTNTTPNVCITYPDHIATYITGSNNVVDLNMIIDDEKYGLGGSELLFDGPNKDEIITKFLQEGLIDGKQYALPFMRSTEALYINSDFVKKLGYSIPEVVTWDYIFEVSEAALKKNDDGTYWLNNQNVMIPFIYKSTDNMMISMLAQLDAPYSDDQGNIEIYNDTTAKILKQIGEHAYTGAFNTFKNVSYPGNYLNAGQCVFAIDSTAGASWLGCDAPCMDIQEDAVVRFNTVVKQIPQYDIDNIKMISQGPSICIFNKQDNQEVLASWLFAQFLLTNDVQNLYCKSEGYIPVTSKAIESSEYKNYLVKSGIDNDEHYSVKIDASKLVIDNINNTFVTPVFNGSASLRTAAGQLIETVVLASKREQAIDEEYIDYLYDLNCSLYKLDQFRQMDMESDLGPLPIGSKALLISLGFIWLVIAIAYINKVIKSNKK